MMRIQRVSLSSLFVAGAVFGGSSVTVRGRCSIW